MHDLRAQGTSTYHLAVAAVHSHLDCSKTCWTWQGPVDDIDLGADCRDSSYCAFVGVCCECEVEEIRVNLAE
jgi:hypothetical protein